MTNSARRFYLPDKQYDRILAVIQTARDPQELRDLVVEYPLIIKHFLLRYRIENYTSRA